MMTQSQLVSRPPKMDGVELKRQMAKNTLLDSQGRGEDPHLNCLKVMGGCHSPYDHRDFTDHYVFSFLDWLFSDDPVKYRSWKTRVMCSIVARRDWARDRLALCSADGRDPCSICCDIQALLYGHDPSEVFVDDKVESAEQLVRWVFADDQQELTRWLNQIGSPSDTKDEDGSQDSEQESVDHDISVDEIRNAARAILDSAYLQTDGGWTPVEWELRKEKAIVCEALEKQYGFYSTVKIFTDVEIEYRQTKRIPFDPFGHLLGIPGTGNPSAPIRDERAWQCAKGTVLFLPNETAALIQQIGMTMTKAGASERILDDLVEALVKQSDGKHHRSLEHRLYWAEIHANHEVHKDVVDACVKETKERTKKVYLDQLGYDPHVRRLVAEVPVEWTDDDIGHITGCDLFSCFGLINTDWENTGDGVIPQGEVELIGLAPDDAVPDVTFDGPPLPPPAEGSNRSE